MVYQQMLIQPLWMILAILILSVLDYYLTMFSSNLYKKAFADSVEYKSTKGSSSNREKRRSLLGAGFLWLKLLLILVLLIIWFQAKITQSQIVEQFYFFILGFTFFNFLIIDLRHLQNVLIFSYAAKHPQEISGKVSYHRSFSLMQSAFQLVLPFILVLVIFAFHPSFFLFGAILASFFLIVRNTFLAQRAKNIIGQPTKS